MLLPFRWELVDALYYLPHFAALRGTEEPLPPRAPARGDRRRARGPFAVLIFHPFLLEDEERFEVLRLGGGACRASAPCREVARDVTAAG